MQQIKVMIVDDDIFVRQALEALLRKHPMTTPDKIFSDISSAIDDLSIREDYPDVILLDIQFAGSEKTGIDAIKNFKIFNEEKTKILVCSMKNDSEYIISAIKAGADGFIWKNESGDGIISAIIKIIEGRFVVTKSIAEQIMGQAITLDKYVEVVQERKNYKKLTEELRKTMYLYCYCAMSAKEIADELKLSVHTVNSRIKIAYNLLDATSKAEAFSKLVERE